MLRQTPPACNARVKQIVDRLVREDGRITAERRSAHRVPLVRPAEIILPDEDLPVDACIRNISGDGAGIISSLALPIGTRARVRILSLFESDPLILGEVRWCTPFGSAWYLSGWKFLSEARSS